MAKISSQRDIKSEINIIPFLDVLLVLMLIFMVTISTATQIEVELPSATNVNAINNENNTQVIFEVFDTGQYRLLINHHQEQLTSKKLILKARDLIANNPKTSFLVGGSKNVPYCEVIKLLSLLHQAGIKSVGLMTHPV